MLYKFVASGLVLFEKSKILVLGAHPTIASTQFLCERVHWMRMIFLGVFSMQLMMILGKGYPQSSLNGQRSKWPSRISKVVVIHTAKPTNSASISSLAHSTLVNLDPCYFEIISSIQNLSQFGALSAADGARDVGNSCVASRVKILNSDAAFSKCITWFYHFQLLLK